MVVIPPLETHGLRGWSARRAVGGDGRRRCWLRRGCRQLADNWQYIGTHAQNNAKEDKHILRSLSRLGMSTVHETWVPSSVGARQLFILT